MGDEFTGSTCRATLVFTVLFKRMCIHSNLEYIWLFFRAFYQFNMIYTTRTENEPTIRVGSNGKIISRLEVRFDLNKFAIWIKCKIKKFSQKQVKYQNE